jgi:hypothetical protein
MEAPAAHMELSTPRITSPSIDARPFMNTIALRAEAALHAHPHPALKIPELLDLIANDVDRSLTAERLRSILQSHPDRFRILEAWTRRWKSTHADDGDSVIDRTWVVAIADRGDPPDGPRSVMRLRESVRWLGRGIDGRSALEVSRWYAITLAERDARAALVRTAA